MLFTQTYTKTVWCRAGTQYMTPSKSWMNAFENDMFFSEMPLFPSPLGEYCLICVLITILTIGGDGFKGFHTSLWDMIQLHSMICILNHIYILHIYIYIHILYIEWLKKRTPSKHTNPSLSTGKSLAFKLTRWFYRSPSVESFGRQAQW